ncbi:alpha/beta fold hydrolase [Dyella humicola]|uniref:alpha/beta fold hydrolase n=1 Tax=Dyella humicola TaxID=2992126 RepID=UPI002256BD8A|nr:alpha/beta hydrolase [Dyella humicola]
MDARLSPHQQVDIQGRPLAYRTAGDDDGEPVVLIHAFASQSASWTEVAGALARRGFRVIVPDLRGHGRSAWADSYALEDFEQDLIGLLDALQLRYMSLVGHSLGGHLALRLAMRLADRIDRLVIEAAPVPPRDAADAAELQALQAKPAWWRSARTLGAARIARLWLLREFDFRSARTVLPALRAPMPHWWQGLGTIEAPCLLLASHNDGAVTRRIGLLANQLPHASTHYLGSGHRLHTEHAEAFLDVVVPFLTDKAPLPRHA